MFFCTHIFQITKLLLELNQLYLEIEPKMTDSSTPDAAMLKSNENDYLLEGRELLPRYCYSYQTCQAMRLLLFSARLGLMNNEFSPVSFAKLLDSNYTSHFLTSPIGGYSTEYLVAPLEHLQAFLTPECYSVRQAPS